MLLGATANQATSLDRLLQGSRAVFPLCWKRRLQAEKAWPEGLEDAQLKEERELTGSFGSEEW